MSSNINPNNIDTAYPVAGQDNDSQGFRDNFTNIKSNFTSAQIEIEDLQDNVLVKNPISGDEEVNNNLNGALISAAKIQDFRETVNAIGTPSDSNQTLNYAAGHYHTLTTTQPISVGFSNLPELANHGKWRLAIEVTNVAHTLTLPAAVSLGTDGIQGIDANVIEFDAVGTYIFEFSTSDGGTTVHVDDLTRGRTAVGSATAKSITLTDFAQLPVLSAAPTTPVNGMVVVSDGTGWDPHSEGNQQVSAYLNGIWVKLS